MRQRRYRPGYFILEPLPVEHHPPPDRARGIYGSIEIQATCRTPLHVGSGVPERAAIEGRPSLVEGFQSLPYPGEDRRVVPGSSVKGAVRAVVEALTPSCARTDRGAVCGDPRRDPRGLCPACALLGAPGWRALVAFSDLRPEGDAMSRAAVRVAQRHSHPRAPRRGRRLYRRQPEEPQPTAEEVLIVLPAGSGLRGEIALLGAPPEGAGLVALALGLPPHGLPYLRLGGGKNRGLGVLDVSARSIIGSGPDEGPLARGALPLGLVADWEAGALARFPQAQARLDAIRRYY